MVLNTFKNDTYYLYKLKQETFRKEEQIPANEANVWE